MLLDFPSWLLRLLKLIILLLPMSKLRRRKRKVISLTLSSENEEKGDKCERADSAFLIILFPSDLHVQIGGVNFHLPTFTSSSINHVSTQNVLLQFLLIQLSKLWRLEIVINIDFCFLNYCLVLPEIVNMKFCM